MCVRYLNWSGIKGIGLLVPSGYFDDVLYHYYLKVGILPTNSIHFILYLYISVPKVCSVRIGNVSVVRLCDCMAILLYSGTLVFYVVVTCMTNTNH